MDSRNPVSSSDLEIEDTHMAKSGKHHFRIFGQNPLDLFREIVVLVLGILIAFWLNNWWTDRQLKGEEAEIIEALYKEFQTNLGALKMEQDQLESQIAITWEMLELTNLPIDSIPSETADTLLGYLMSIPKFDPFSGVIQEILNSGQLSLLSNDELRIQLAAWPANLAQIRAMQDYWKRRATNVIIPYLYSRAAFVNMDSRRSSYSSGAVHIHSHVDNRKVFGDLEFQNIVDDQLWNFNNLKSDHRELEKIMNQILQLLAGEIENQNIHFHNPQIQ